MVIYFSAAAKSSGIKEAESEAAIKTWLKYAADRNGGRKRRAEKQKGKYSAVRTRVFHYAHCVYLRLFDYSSILITFKGF